MAEFAVVDDGHSWNNALAHETYADNVREHGQERALALLRADIRSWIRERRGEQHQWSLTVRDGQMVTETGVSLQTMTKNITHGPHSDLVPEHIKATAPLEAATLEEATRLAVSGTERIVLPEQHLDDRGNVVARYLSVWTKDASDPTRYHGSRIDLGKNLRIEDVRTGASFAAVKELRGVTFHQSHEQKNAFVLSVHKDSVKPFEAITQTITTAVYRSHQETYLPKTVKEDIRYPALQPEASKQLVSWATTEIRRDQQTDLIIDVPRVVIRETADTIRGAAIFWRTKQEQKKTGEQKEASKYSLPVSIREERLERLTLEEIRKEPVRVRKVIEKKHREMKRDAAAIAVIAATGVGIGAVPELVARMAAEPDRSIAAVKKSVRRHEKRELRMKNKELRIRREKQRKTRREKGEIRKVYREQMVGERRQIKRKKRRFSFERIDKKYAAAEKLSIRRKEKRKRIRRRRMRTFEIGVKKIAAAVKITPIERKEILGKWKERTKKERKPIVRVIRRIKRMLEKKQLPKREKRLAFAWVLWVLLSLKKPHLVLQGAALKKPVERIVPMEETPWILLSIIWFLTMRKEGNVAQPAPTYQTTTVTGAAPSIPQYAVIFAYAS